MLSERLKKETQQPHLELEKLIIPQIKGIQTTSDYGKLLLLFYGYFKPVEKIIETHVNTELFEDFDQRRKAEVLMADLNHIEVTGNNLSLCKELPVISNTQSALGAMYVLEGSTLGGKIISKMIMNKLQLESNQGVQFFSGYGDDTEEKWIVFKNFLDNYTDNVAIQEEIILAANETFIKFKNWVELTDEQHG